MHARIHLAVFIACRQPEHHNRIRVSVLGSNKRSIGFLCSVDILYLAIVAQEGHHQDRVVSEKALVAPTGAHQSV